MKNPGTVHNLFFVAWFFGFPDGSQGEWYQGPSQGGSNWDTGERSWEAKNINVLMSSCNIYSQLICFWLECHMNMARRMVAVFVDHVFLWVFFLILWREMIQFHEHRGMQSFSILLGDGFKHVFFLFGPGKLNLFWLNTGKFFPLFWSTRMFFCCCGGEGDLHDYEETKKTCSFIWNESLLRSFVKFCEIYQPLSGSSKISPAKHPSAHPS